MMASTTNKGHCACPICGPNTPSRYSEHLSKVVYGGRHRMWLPADHPFCFAHKCVQHCGSGYCPRAEDACTHPMGHSCVRSTHDLGASRRGRRSGFMEQHKVPSNTIHTAILEGKYARCTHAIIVEYAHYINAINLCYQQGRTIFIYARMYIVSCRICMFNICST